MAASLAPTGCAKFKPPGFHPLFTRDVTYRGGDATLGMTVFSPARPGAGGLRLAPAPPHPPPIVLLLHGGAFHFGDRELMRPLADHLARLGFVTAAAQYRLAPEHPFPAGVQDTVAAVRHLRAHAGEYGGDPDRIAILGLSAGANLAMLAAYCADPDAAFGACGDARISPRVQAVINVYGPVDLALEFEKAAWWVKPLIYEYLGIAAADEHPEVWRAASPIHLIDAGDPPTLTVHGRHDRIVGYQQALLLDRTLKSAGVPHTLVPVDSGHGWAYGDDVDSARLTALSAVWLARTLECETAGARGRGR